MTQPRQYSLSYLGLASKQGFEDGSARSTHSFFLNRHFENNIFGGLVVVVNADIVGPLGNAGLGNPMIRVGKRSRLYRGVSLSSDLRWVFPWNTQPSKNSSLGGVQSNQILTLTSDDNRTLFRSFNVFRYSFYEVLDNQTTFLFYDRTTIDYKIQGDFYLGGIAVAAFQSKPSSGFELGNFESGPGINVALKKDFMIGAYFTVNPLLDYSPGILVVGAGVLL